MTLRPALALATALAVAAPLTAPQIAWAAAPQPTKPVAASFYSGRWYEIARIPNAGQRDCQAPYTQFTTGGAGAFQVSQICRQGSPAGKARTFNTKGRVLPGANNAKFEMSFLGGMKKQEYWVLDCAADGSWAIMATPGGNYIWLLSRKEAVTQAVRDALVARIRALGYGQKLEFPAH
ncbi:lipocalin family protein [Caulobacter mirabilis]|uniref:Outer membrane lipoprotein Blc n=1 Tax=Caulobacter mirabilis TaxID=69666 RepID=A0A2D2B3F2_9CAUL|nr:lipocalin family protein [Caulobacter mirabilis]ATQ44736.1 lipocalin [Caulobacter mirabilis]